jgi:hypothetical protein
MEGHPRTLKREDIIYVVGSSRNVVCASEVSRVMKFIDAPFQTLRQGESMSSADPHRTGELGWIQEPRMESQMQHCSHHVSCWVVQ